MSNLIDREDFKQQQLNESRYLLHYGKCYFSLDDLKEAPTIDAQPVVHGHWTEKNANGQLILCNSCLDKVSKDINSIKKEGNKTNE